jgi:hypothetical protein
MGGSERNPTEQQFRSERLSVFVNPERVHLAVQASHLQTATDATTPLRRPYPGLPTIGAEKSHPSTTPQDERKRRRLPTWYLAQELPPAPRFRAARFSEAVQNAQRFQQLAPDQRCPRPGICHL